MITSADIERDERFVTIRALNRCIETCMDGEKGYGAAAADVRDPMLKSLFRHYEEQRADFVRELQRTVDAFGASHENQGTLRGTLHRGWTGTRLQIAGRKDETIVDECLRGETSALRAYDRALVDGASFPDHVRALLVHQREAIATGVADMKHRLAFPADREGVPEEARRH